MKKQHSTTNFAAPFLHNDRTHSFNDWYIRRTIDRDSTWQILGEQNTIVYPRKWSSSSFQLIFLVGVELVFVHVASFRTSLSAASEDRSGESTTHRRLRCNEKTSPVYFAVLQGLLTTQWTRLGTLNWCRSTPCANFLHGQLTVDDLMDNGQLFS